MSDIANVSICALKAIQYKISEGVLLKFLRKKYESYYENEQNPLISCYVPTYNRAKLLIDRAVTSVLNQTHKNLELIIIGDRCTDETTEMVSNLKDKRIRYKNLNYKRKPFPETKKNIWRAGEVIAANYALSISRGQWIARIDDEEWTIDHLEKLLMFSTEKNYEFVSGNVEITDLNTTYIDKGQRIYSEYFRNEKRNIPDDKNPYLSGHSSWLYRSYLKYFKYNIQCWRKSHNRVNDVDLALRFLNAGVRIGYLDDLVTLLKIRPGEKNIGWAAVNKP